MLEKNNNLHFLEHQQFLEIFKALMEFKDKYLDRDRQAQQTVLQKKLYKKYEGFGTEGFPKTANDADQTDL